MRLLLFASVLAAACGDVAPTKQDAKTADAPIDVKLVDAPIDAAVDAPDAPPGTFPLKVKNILNWCSVRVNNGAPSSAAEQTVNVTPGTIPLAADPLSGFALAANMWHHTTGDAGNGEAGTVSGMTSSTTVVVGMAAKCVWVCCPFTNGTGCPTTDQCP